MTELELQRLCDLPLHNVAQRLKKIQGKLQRELKARGLVFDFHLWVSDEWFCPDGVPGFALPFYLFNKDLMAIQKQELGFVDGCTDREIFKLARHELGHAIDNAYGLRRSRLRQSVFGSSQKEYPTSYDPKPYSKRYVNYLGDQYAQSHPDEDFAETFAYWLDPGKSWRFRRLSSQVQQKLEGMDQIMRRLRHHRPVLKNRYRIDPIEKNTTLLADHYRILKKDRGLQHFDRVDQSLRMMRVSSQGSLQAISLAKYLREERKALSRNLSAQAGVFQYEADRAIKTLIKRAESLRIEAPVADLRTKTPSLIERNFRYLKEKGQLEIQL